MAIVTEALEAVTRAVAVMPKNGSERSSANESLRDRRRSGKDSACRRWSRNCGAASNRSVRAEPRSNESAVLNENRCTSFVRGYPN
ncbi:hypothetical protein [Diadegma fenestrale ichnovirus]|nr:hypothetical protein [Diadegma fenestrale ichnovirus]